MHMLLHLYLRNPDGSIAGDAWGMLVIGAWLILAGAASILWPRWTTRQLARSEVRVGRFSVRGSVISRISGVVAVAAGVGLILWILNAAPGKLY